MKGKLEMKIFKLFFIVISLLALIYSEHSYSQVTQEWAARYNGPGGSDDASFVTIDNSLNAYVLGQTGTASSSDLVIIKYNPSGDTVWTRKYNGPSESEDLPAGISVDTLGNIYVTGTTIGFGTGYDIVTLKYDPSGNQQWARIYNGTGNGDDKASDIELTPSGNNYVSGESAGAGTGLDFITIKYNSAGTQQWVDRRNGTANITDRAIDIDVKNGLADTIFVTGTIFNTGSLSDYLTIKLNSSGDQIWAKTYNGTENENENAQSIATDQTGNVYVTGRIFNTATSFDYVTVKYYPGGDTGWVRRYNGEIGNGADIPRKIKIDASGNPWVTGYSLGSVTGYDYATIKYNSSGVQQFVKKYVQSGHDYAYGLDIDPFGSAYVTGQSPGIGTGNDYLTIKYGPLGDSLWVRRYNGTGNGSDIARFVKVDNLKNVYVTGQSFGTTGNDIVTIKYSQASYYLIGKAYMEAFYNSISNNMRSDTATVYLKNNTSPYNTIDLSKGVLSVTGIGTFTFSNAVNGTNYYLAIKHRNSIETWSNSVVTFSNDSLTYDFSVSASQAYGNNQIQVDASPVRFAIYSGDVNQDGIVDATDLSYIDNDAFNFITGYVATDVNGDDIVDGSDAEIVDNNAFNFVSRITP